MNITPDLQEIKKDIAKFGDAGYVYQGKTAMLRVVPFGETNADGMAIFMMHKDEPVFFTQLPGLEEKGLANLITDLRTAADLDEEDLPDFISHITAELEKMAAAYISKNN